MKKQKLRAGIIGCGRAAAPGHALPYRLHPRVELAAVCDPDEEKAAKLAKRFGIKDVYGDAVEMMDGAGLDVVSVCTPTFLHAEQTGAAAARGIHVMCEKPMASGPAEGERMIKVCADAGVVLHIGYNKRFDAGILKVRNLVAAAAYGRCFQAEFRWYGLLTMGNVPAVRSAWKALGALGVSSEGFSPSWRFDDPRTPGGVLEVFCHIIDLALWMFGEPEEAVTKTRVLAGEGKKPDHAVILLTFPGGETVYLTMSSRVLALWEREEAVFHCEKGNIRYSTNSQRQAALPARVRVERDAGPFGLRVPVPAMPPIGRGLGAIPHYRKIDCFVREVLGNLPEGEARIVCRGADGLLVDRIINKMEWNK